MLTIVFQDGTLKEMDRHSELVSWNIKDNFLILDFGESETVYYNLRFVKSIIAGTDE